MIVKPPIVLTGSFEIPTVLSDIFGASFLKKRLEFSSAVAYPISQSARVSRI